MENRWNRPGHERFPILRTGKLSVPSPVFVNDPTREYGIFIENMFPLSRVKYCPVHRCSLPQAVQSEQYFKGRKPHSHQAPAAV
ncbi:MAG: hypothetical protein ACLURV_00645 [Gallintestinimicrobium sp.]